MEVDISRLQQQFAFIQEIDKEKTIFRQTYLSDASRKENDAEHSWHMAVMAILLSEYSNEKIDVLKTVSMILVHDLVEIYAGDTYAYDTEGNNDKAEREIKAADKLFSLLLEDQRDKFRAFWDEFEAGETPEAKFAITMDRIQPLMLNNASGGRSWQEHGVKSSQVYGRNVTTAQGSEILWKYADENFIQPNIGNTLKVEL